MSDEHLPAVAGPVPDRLTIWSVDDGRYGLDAIFLGASGYERAERHEAELERRGIPHSFRQELGGAWTLRFGPLRAIELQRSARKSMASSSDSAIARCTLVRRGRELGLVISDSERRDHVRTARRRLEEVILILTFVFSAGRVCRGSGVGEPAE